MPLFSDIAKELNRLFEENVKRKNTRPQKINAELQEQERFDKYTVSLEEESEEDDFSDIGSYAVYEEKDNSSDNLLQVFDRTQKSSLYLHGLFLFSIYY